MKTILSLGPVVGGLALLAGCGQPTHLQYDHSRAFQASMQVQTDLSRASVADAAYPLSGEEGIALRERVVEEATDAETNMAEFVQSFTTE